RDTGYRVDDAWAKFQCVIVSEVRVDDKQWIDRRGPASSGLKPKRTHCHVVGSICVKLVHPVHAERARCSLIDFLKDYSRPAARHVYVKRCLITAAIIKTTRAAECTYTDRHNAVGPSNLKCIRKICIGARES